MAASALDYQMMIKLPKTWIIPAHDGWVACKLPWHWWEDENPVKLVKTPVVAFKVTAETLPEDERYGDWSDTSTQLRPITVYGEVWGETTRSSSVTRAQFSNLEGKHFANEGHALDWCKHWSEEARHAAAEAEGVAS